VELAEGIKKIGFRRWYERQLIESHAYLVTGLLSSFLVLGSMESLSARAPGWEPIVLLVLVLGAGALASWAVYRYLAILTYAEYVGGHSTCGSCSAYGIIEVTRARARARREEEEEEGAESAPSALGVRCRKCGHEWTIE
jgi:hypothetical protein